MSRSSLPRPEFRPRYLSRFPQLDWFALYLITAAVLFFAFYPLLFFGPPANHWVLWPGRAIPLGDTLTIILSLEAFLLVWLWLEMPRRRKAERALKKLHSVQRAISRVSGNIVSLKGEELAEGLQSALYQIGQMLEVDHISWFQQSAHTAQFACVQTSQVSQEIIGAKECPLSSLPWMVEAVLNGAPVRLQRLQDLPPEAHKDRAVLHKCGVKSLAVIPSAGSEGINALVLSSFTKELSWDEEVVAQMSVMAAVFASAYATKILSEAGKTSELKFRHLFEDSPIGIALLDSTGQMQTSNATLGKLLGYGSQHLNRKNIIDVMHPEEMAQTWLQLQEVVAGARETAVNERKLLRRDGSVICGRLTFSLACGKAVDGPYLLAMIEDVTDTNLAREQLERTRRMLTLSLESSRITAWEYDPLTGMISWLDRNKLRDGAEQPDMDLFSNVLSRVYPEDREKLRFHAAAILETGGAFNAEYRMIARDGSIRWMLGKGELLRHSGESAPKILGVTVDVTEVKRAQFQLEQLAKRLMQAQEDERKRISRELHDDIGQRVALLAIELDLVRQQLTGERGHIRERIEQLQSFASELGSDLHLLSHALHSSKLKHLGLEAALRELCTRMGNKQGLSVELIREQEAKPVSEDDALVLYRVAQEALNNVSRHSAASKVEVSLQFSETHATLTVRDNGQGFDLSANSEGIGLVGMRERLRAVGGELKIFSAPGAGTEIHASIVLAKLGQTASVRGAAAGLVS